MALGRAHSMPRLRSGQRKPGSRRVNDGREGLLLIIGVERLVVERREPRRSFGEVLLLAAVRLDDRPTEGRRAPNRQEFGTVDGIHRLHRFLLCLNGPRRIASLLFKPKVQRLPSRRSLSIFAFVSFLSPLYPVDRRRLSRGCRLSAEPPSTCSDPDENPSDHEASVASRCPT